MLDDAPFLQWRARTELTLQAALGGQADATRLLAAMRHAVLGGGKRLRPLLVRAGGHALGAGDDALDAAAASVELIHGFSLVHDDLPAMDDDDLRRGRPTVHVAFDVATAILAGDALQAQAFSVLADAPIDAAIRIALVRELAQASGARGMCGGQSLDMLATGQELDLAGLQQVHRLKTGALIRASVRMGGLCANAGAEALARLDIFADALGLAFQIRDDILDVEGNSDQLGKTAGKDARQNKATYPALLGLADSNARLEALSGRMRDALEPLGDAADPLRRLGRFAVTRVS